MSKKSVVRGFGWKLAAAALAAAGVAGTAGAQPLNGIDPNGGTVNMSVGYEVQTLAQIFATPNARLTNETLLTIPVNAFSAIGNTRGEGPGTLGTIRVLTNSANWDVKMRTANGGRLIDASGATTKQGACNTWDAWGVVCQTWFPDTIIGGEYLTYFSSGTSSASGIIQGASRDTVRLQVAVGLANLGAVLSSGANATSVYALGAPAAPIPPVEVAHTALDISNVAAGAATGPISLAATIAGNGAYIGAAAALTPTMTQFSGRDWSDIASDGFNVPNYTNDFSSPTPPAVLTHKNEEYFFVNVAIETTNNGPLGGNKGGNYTETFYFDLVASF